ncbi:CBS domain-containing protein [Streptomyces thermocarboxydus]|uniref:CBS domain-containing protein n=1 Tax=Streptomyces cellulosae TaxID=1968 RepID=A0ABW6JGI3_STRCE|nr:CBS domain-containing protein [Streptomyces sp. AC04842]MDN3288526.1 CBS domain-containing protein [Streptomyces thermocarboxydus]GHE48367.1 oxidoreductase [Streptomyces cellulosae]
MAQYVRDIMTAAPVSVGPYTSVAQAARLMRDHDLGAVLVTDDGQLRGLVTDRDLVVRSVADGVDPEETTVVRACSEDLVTVRPDDELDLAVRLMREHAVRRVPVVDGEHPVGVLSLGDVALERDPDSALADIRAARPHP